MHVHPYTSPSTHLQYLCMYIHTLHYRKHATQKILTDTWRIIQSTQHGQKRFKESLNVIRVIVVTILDQKLQHTKDLHRVKVLTHAQTHTQGNRSMVM